MKDWVDLRFRGDIREAVLKYRAMIEQTIPAGERLDPERMEKWNIETWNVIEELIKIFRRAK